MQTARWPERWDCALLTSKGQATRATKDLLDLLGDTDEDITFYCIHDADAPGTTIYQALQEATRTRGRRRVHIENLGLDPWEAADMGLEYEAASYKRRAPVADYVHRYDTDHGTDWAGWLQSRRVELNAMHPDAFISWLDDKMSERGAVKVIPPRKVLTERLAADVRAHLREQITARVLADARVEDQIDAAYSQIERSVYRTAVTLDDFVTNALEQSSTEPWTEPVRRAAVQLVDGGTNAEVQSNEPVGG